MKTQKVKVYRKDSDLNELEPSDTVFEGYLKKSDWISFVVENGSVQKEFFRYQYEYLEVLDTASKGLDFS